jgi:hypothetical protein
VRRLLSILIGSAPFVFGAIRLVQTHTDFRYLVVAAASFIGAILVTDLTATRTGRMTMARAVSALGLATLCGTLAALAIGGGALAPTLIVSFAFSVCAVGSRWSA